MKSNDISKTVNNETEIWKTHEKWRTESVFQFAVPKKGEFFFRYSSSEALGLKIVEQTIYFVPLSSFYSELLNKDDIAIDGPRMVKDSSITAKEGEEGEEEEVKYTVYLSNTEFVTKISGNTVSVEQATPFNLNEPLMVKDSSITKPIAKEVKLNIAFVSQTSRFVNVRHEELVLAA